MRLIDADALLKALNDYGLSYRADINGMIMQAPTIEPSGELISRADAIEAVAKLQKYDLDERNRLRIYAPWHKPKRIFVETEAIYKCIYTMPSADAESVVRCKDCKYSFYDKDYESYNCRKHEYVELFDADDYCSWGERND